MDNDIFCLDHNNCKQCYLAPIPFLKLEPFPLSPKPKQSEHAAKNPLTIPALKHKHKHTLSLSLQLKANKLNPHSPLPHSTQQFLLQ